MAIAKKDRFVEGNLRIPVEFDGTFPPEKIVYNGVTMQCLGVSNKRDLLPVNIDNQEMQRVVTYGTIEQFVFTAENGDLYDVCLYSDDGSAYIYGIRTRQV